MKPTSTDAISEMVAALMIILGEQFTTTFLPRFAVTIRSLLGHVGTVGSTVGL